MNKQLDNLNIRWNDWATWTLGGYRVGRVWNVKQRTKPKNKNKKNKIKLEREWKKELGSVW